VRLFEGLTLVSIALARDTDELEISLTFLDENSARRAEIVIPLDELAAYRDELDLAETVNVFSGGVIVAGVPLKEILF
jgi:hypothetical protein